MVPAIFWYHDAGNHKETWTILARFGWRATLIYKTEMHADLSATVDQPTCRHSISGAPRGCHPPQQQRNGGSLATLHPTPEPLGMVRRREGDGVGGLRFGLLLGHLRQNLAECSKGSAPRWEVIDGWRAARAGRQGPQPSRPAGSRLGAGTASGSFAVDRELAEPGQGVVGIPGLAELGAERPNSFLRRVAEAGRRPQQVDESPAPRRNQASPSLRRWKPWAMAPMSLSMVAYCGRCKRRRTLG